MKKFRLLAVMIITVAMLFTVALAADNSIDAVEYNGTDDTITVVVRPVKAGSIGMFTNFGLVYDPAIFEYASSTSSNATAMLQKETSGGQTYIAWSTAADVQVEAGDALLSVVFNVLDKSKVVGYTFEMSAVTTMWDAAYGMYDWTATMTVEAAAAQEEVVDATVVEENADAVVYGAENSYWGVWVGTYKVALNGKTLQSAVVTFEGVDGKSFPTQNTDWAEGEGEATFKIAIIGVPDEYADKSVAKATLK